jgi:hypothetical protein
VTKLEFRKTNKCKFSGGQFPSKQKISTTPEYPLGSVQKYPIEKWASLFGQTDILSPYMPSSWFGTGQNFSTLRFINTTSTFQIKRLTSSSIRDTIVQIVYFTDFNKQLFVLSTCFDFHFETVILTTPTQQKISHTKINAPDRGYTRSQRNAPLLLHSNTQLQEEGCSVTDW